MNDIDKAKNLIMGHVCGNCDASEYSLPRQEYFCLNNNYCTILLNSSCIKWTKWEGRPGHVYKHGNKFED